ncbi:uncharacterized protein LOC110011407 [Sesamum indicum]|uniref:Uncharacterized protein LOC110011407 n=1 Tax=Sesamum indicum TaxID=4182 RepID=A0A8M8UT46_SESIN|nr:uncharacterized protein LOC110011407 [Sesamum indicum]
MGDAAAELVEYTADVINDASPDDVSHDASPDDVSHDASPDDVSHDASRDDVSHDASPNVVSHDVSPDDVSHDVSPDDVSWWEENFIDVHILDLGEQFVHCRITSKAVNESIIVTVVYGATEVIDRWILWTTLETLAQQCSDVPWLVGGDFNAVRDLNESIWHHEVVGIPMYAVTRKLKALKPVFRLQRRNKGDLTLNVQLAKGFLDEAQQLINDENGTTHTDQGEVAHEFVSYYQNLLGGTRRRLTVDIRYLRPWARHCITDEEASHLLLPISPNDVKQAVFDIAEDKAPGPDGYLLGFFKAAWPVIGEEVTRAVLDFFSTEKLLKQINSTILALIPKRLSVLLDKIISPCQTAFIPGRSIGDNIYASPGTILGL